MYWVYILESKGDRGWYIGYTENLKRRIEEHTAKSGGRTTKTKNDWYLIYCEGYQSQKDALGRERFLKSGGGRRYIKKQLSHYLNRSEQ